MNPKYNNELDISKIKQITLLSKNLKINLELPVESLFSINIGETETDYFKSQNNVNVIFKHCKEVCLKLYADELNKYTKSRITDNATKPSIIEITFDDNITVVYQAPRARECDEYYSDDYGINIIRLDFFVRNDYE